MERPWNVNLQRQPRAQPVFVLFACDLSVAVWAQHFLVSALLVLIISMMIMWPVNDLVIVDEWMEIIVHSLPLATLFSSAILISFCWRSILCILSTSSNGVTSSSRRLLEPPASVMVNETTASPLGPHPPHYTPAHSLPSLSTLSSGLRWAQ